MSNSEAFSLALGLVVSIACVYTAIFAIRKGDDLPAAMFIIGAMLLTGLSLLTIYKADVIATATDSAMEPASRTRSEAQEKKSLNSGPVDAMVKELS